MSLLVGMTIEAPVLMNISIKIKQMGFELFAKTEMKQQQIGSSDDDSLKGHQILLQLGERNSSGIFFTSLPFFLFFISRTASVSLNRARN